MTGLPSPFAVSSAKDHRPTAMGVKRMESRSVQVSLGGSSWQLGQGELCETHESKHGEENHGDAVLWFFRLNASESERVLSPVLQNPQLAMAHEGKRSTLCRETKTRVNADTRASTHTDTDATESLRNALSGADGTNGIKRKTEKHSRFPWCLVSSPFG